MVVNGGLVFDIIRKNKNGYIYLPNEKMQVWMEQFQTWNESIDTIQNQVRVRPV